MVVLVALGNNACAEPTASGTLFRKGAWVKDKWSSIRLIEQKESRTFRQRDTSIGNDSFSNEDIEKGIDNIILVTDTKNSKATIELVFSMGAEEGAAPGFVLSPEIRDGVLVKGIAIFVAAKRMAVWKVSADTASQRTDYKFLVQINRLSNPGAKHKLKCSYAENGNATIKLDQSDSLSFRFRDHKMNSLVGIWGCHGTCDFYEMRVE